MMRPLLFLALLALAAIRPAESGAQDAAPPAQTGPAQTGPAQTGPAQDARTLSAAQAQQALDVLQDPQKREQLIAVLRAIAAAEPKAAQPPAAAPPPAPATPAPATPAAAVSLKPHSLGAQLLFVLSRWSGELTAEAAATLRTMNKLPDLGQWLVALEADPHAAAALLAVVGWLALVIGCALFAEFLGIRVLRRPREALGRQHARGNGQSTQLLRILPYALVRLVLDLVPVAVFALTGNLLAAVIPAMDGEARLVVIAIVNAYAACRATMCVGRMLLSPDVPRLRLWRLDNHDARFVLVWLRRLVVVAVFGNALVEAALLLGLDQSAHDGFARLITLVLTVMLIVVVIRSRRPMAAYIGGVGASRWRRWLAEAWPYLAVITIVSFWIGIVTGTRGGLSGLYFPAVTLAAIIAARLLTIVVLGTLERLMRFDPQGHEALPGLNRRLARYRRPLEGVVVAVIAMLCVVAILQLWGAPAFAWFVSGHIGRHLISALATVAVAAIVAIAVWEVTQAMLERQLSHTAEGQARSVRLLTLLPLLRATLLTTIVTVVGLTALSEIGVNIAPLLAGAGIAGVAIGFGSQRLVQDVITGIFVLFENAMQIGDGVTVAGLSGSVEQLSIRTIRLRAGDGAMHIIPFSAITTITNNNRGLGNAAISVTVAYDEDTDRVTQVLKEIAAEMHEDEKCRAQMLGDLQIFGVDQVKPWGVTIVGQIATTDAGRLPVQREFNRRLKKRFAAEGIALSASPAG